MRWRAPSSIERRIGELVSAARLDARAGEIDVAWARLGDAHVLSQAWALSHVRVHWTMLVLGWRTRDVREVTGQAFRLVVAAPGSLTGRYLARNWGHSDVSTFAAAPVRDDLADLLAMANDHGDGGGSEVLAPSEVRTLYDRMAPFYDVVSRPNGWFGSKRLAERAIEELRLRPGDTVVALGTGAGRNLSELAAAVGPAGRALGVDLSPEMLERARRRAVELSLNNVELVEADMSTFEFAAGVDGVVSSYAVEMLPDHVDVIARLVGQAESNQEVVR